MRFSARIFGFLFAFLLVLFVSKTSFAQVTTVTQENQYLNNETNSDVPNNLHNLSQGILIDIMSAMSCQLAGIDPTNKSAKCLGIDPKSQKLGFVENGGGAVGIMGSMISSLYNSPVHTSDFIRYTASGFGITKGAYAADQGVGLSSLSPIFALWKTFRDIAYILFVFVFVVIGVAIMLRVNIDARTVMTIQNQIPKIIICLILITFSIAIAGFLIDVMWILIILIINTLSPLLGGALPQDYVTPFGLSGFVGGFFGVATGTAASIGGGIYKTFNPSTVSDMIKLPAGPGCPPFDLVCGLGDLFAGTIGAAINGILGIIIGTFVGLIVWLIAIVAILWALFKLWFALLGAYISILVDIIFAPFWIFAGLIPGGGSKVGFGAWLRDLAGNLMAFPVTIALFLIAKVIMNGFSKDDPSFFHPPLIGSPGNNFGSLIAFGIIMMMPNIVKMTKAAFKSPNPGFGGVGQGLGIGRAVIGGAIGGGFRRTFKVNPNTHDPEGPGAAWVDKKLTVRLARTFLGFHADMPNEGIRKATKPPEITKV